MNINISTDYSACYISSLAWYHNETRIVIGHRFTITDNGTALHIRNMEASDAGKYEVKINSIDTELLFGEPSDAQCDSRVLPLLESLAAHAPVTFTVQENSPPTRHPPIVVTTVYVTDLNITDTIQLHSISEGDSNFTTHLQIRSSWFRNGSWISDGQRYYNISMIDNQLGSSLIITYNSTEEVAGYYVGLLTVDYYIISGLCRGYSDYLEYILFFHHFIYVPIHASFWRIALYSKLKPLPSVSFLSLFHTGPPSSVLLHFQQPSLPQGESTVVECTAVGGEPREAFNLTLWRNNELLTSVNGECLTYTTQSHLYGTYTCAVGNIQNSSILQERGVHIKVKVIYIAISLKIKPLYSFARSLHTPSIDFMVLAQLACTQCSHFIQNCE